MILGHQLKFYMKFSTKRYCKMILFCYYPWDFNDLNLNISYAQLILPKNALLTHLFFSINILAFNMTDTYEKSKSMASSEIPLMVSERKDIPFSLMNRSRTQCISSTLSGCSKMDLETNNNDHNTINFNTAFWMLFL